MTRRTNNFGTGGLIRARKMALALAAFSALVAGPSVALAAKPDAIDPQKPGVALYPGARHDASTSGLMRTSMGVEGVAYRTGDDLGKVAAFYKKQAGIKPMGDVTKDTAAFAAGCKEEFNAILKKTMTTGCQLHVTAQNPWMDMKTGKLVSDTLITVVKQ